MQKYLRISKKSSTFAPAFREKLRGAIAQLVEQRTENPCVPGSIPGGTTVKKRSIRVSFLCLREYKPGFLAAGARLLPKPFSPPLRSVDYCLAMLDSWWHHSKKDKYR